ncbi:MAG TPA: ribosome biogenesis GTPase Der, partial [bacterium]|nr:ribosome biogenesis GTPase Der [bacterium]
MGKPIVAIVGRPNVGKSSLFNRLVGRRQAIVLDQPGITRDRVYGDVSWGNRVFALIDTGGYVSDAADVLTQSMLANIQQAVQESDLVVFLGDAVDGPTADEYAIAAYLRKTGRPVIVAVNKVDNPNREDLLHAFYGLGFEPVIGISALHGLETGDLLDHIVSLLPRHRDESLQEHKDAIPVAIIGRPNVGKSTLLNSLLGKQRALVDSTPGTTRDPVDVLKEHDGKKYLFVDTAGIRRKGKIERGAEWVSVLLAQQSLDRCKVALLVLDAQEGPVEGDAHVFGLAQKENKACIILANKWDTLEKDDKTSGEMINKIRDTIKFLPYAPIMMISGLTGQRVSKIYDLIDTVYASY